MKKFSVYIFTILILVILWPIFAEWIPALAKSWRWYPVGVLISFWGATKYLTTKQFGWLLMYCIVVLINALTGDTYRYDPISGITTFLGLYIISSAPFILFDDETHRCRKLYFHVFVILLIFTTIMSLIFNMEFPDVVRNDPRMTGLIDTYEYSFLYKYGLTNYQFAHAMPILIPAFVMVFRDRSFTVRKRYIYLVLAVFCMLHTYVSGATTPFLLAIMIFVSSFRVTPGFFSDNKREILIICFLVVPFLFDGVQLLALRVLDNIIGGEGSIHEHLINITENIMSNSISQGNMALRKDLYSYSLESFLSSPLWGVNSEVGGHSIFLDNLAAFGLLGFVPFLLFLTNTYKCVRSYIESKQVSYFFLSALAMFLLMVTKQVNVWTISCFCFVTVPIIMKVSYTKV